MPIVTVIYGFLWRGGGGRRLITGKQGSRAYSAFFHPSGLRTRKWIYRTETTKIRQGVGARDVWVIAHTQHFVYSHTFVLNFSLSSKNR